jgi:hypothetical protein
MGESLVESGDKLRQRQRVKQGSRGGIQSWGRGSRQTNEAKGSKTKQNDAVSHGAEGAMRRGAGSGVGQGQPTSACVARPSTAEELNWASSL